LKAEAFSECGITKEVFFKCLKIKLWERSWKLLKRERTIWSVSRNASVCLGCLKLSWSLTKLITACWRIILSASNFSKTKNYLALWIYVQSIRLLKIGIRLRFSWSALLPLNLPIKKQKILNNSLPQHFRLKGIGKDLRPLPN
jgi:hypothetical protein